MNNYYDDKLAESSNIYKGCAICVTAIVLMLIILLLSGCRSHKGMEKEKTDVSDSVRIEYREKIVKVPVTVYVEVPVEKKERFSRDTTSHLATSFAVSDASIIWIDGVAFLRHSLENIPQKIEKKDTADVVEKEKVMWRTRRVTYTKTEIREKSLSFWEGIKIKFGEVSFGLNILFILVVLLYRKFLRRKD